MNRTTAVTKTGRQIGGLFFCAIVCALFNASGQTTEAASPFALPWFPISGRPPVFSAPPPGFGKPDRKPNAGTNGRLPPEQPNNRPGWPTPKRFET